MKNLFYRLGFKIGEQPGYFLIVPLLLSALCASGFQRITYEADPEYLFSPQEGPAKIERAILEKHFPTNYSEYDPSRAAKAGRFGRLLVTAWDGGSILRSDVWREILFLDEVVRNITIEWEGEILDYEILCALAIDGNCWYNEVLEIGSFMNEIESKEVNLTYPIWFSPDTFKTYTFPMIMGGINTSDIGTINSVSALSLTYFLDTQEDWMKGRGSAWEAAFLAQVEQQNLPHVTVNRFSSLTLEIELEENTNSVIPYFSLNIGIMVMFCIITCMMTDWVKSKPLLGLLGVISAILGSISAFGLVMYCGMDFIGINLAAPFLMLGIGIDDTFVMLAQWRKTSSHDSVPERMGQCYREAAVSITITSITDMLSFWIGVITPFPCVKIFCVYTGTCVVFTYLWHVTFFGGCMAIAGYAEKQNRHAITCCTVLPKSQTDSKGLLYRVFCSGGINPADPWNPRDNKDNGLMVFFRDTIGNALNKWFWKSVVLLVFFCYLAGACYGTSQLREGLEKRRLSRFDSYSVEYYDMEDKYFKEYPFRINVVVSGALDYSDPNVQDDMEELLQKLENTTFIDPLYTEAWLRSFLEYVDRWSDYPEYDQIKVANEQEFITTLQNVYLQGPTAYLQDIDFQSDANSSTFDQHIVGARFVLQGHNIMNSSDESKFVEELRKVCKESKYNVTVFHPYFIYFDQFLVVMPTTVQCVSIAAAVMMVVSLVFIPHAICSFWVVFSIISIELGVIGFMTLWGVNLDSISMINLIMCIGFSVDFSAHISYHYMDSEGGPDERVRNSLYGLGLPIFQGAMSTILGVIGLAIAPSYIFVTFFKMVFLVILLGALHGIFLLPVLLSIFGPGSCSSQEKPKELKSPSTSYLSDGDSLPSKTPQVKPIRAKSKPREERRSSEVRGGSASREDQLRIRGGSASREDQLRIRGGSASREDQLRIPRPTTAATEVDTSGSSPGSVPSTSRPQQQRTKRRRGEGASTSSTGGGRRRETRSEERRTPIHEMYTNNGYISEEEESVSHSQSWRSYGGHHPPSQFHPGVPYYPGPRGGSMVGGSLPYAYPPGAHMYPPYAYPVGSGQESHNSKNSSRHHSRDRKKCKSECKKKRPNK